MQLSPDARILGFTILLSVVSSLVFGLVPAFHGAKSGVIGATKDVRVHRSRVPLRGVLLSLQVGVAVVLLVAAALIANAVRRISAKDLGFTGQGVAVVTVEAPARGFDPARTRTVTWQIADALSRRPNVVLTSTSPLGSGNIKGAFTVPGNSEDQFNSVYEVSPGYFEFLHIPIVAGRPIEIKDADRPVIVINESMARTFWNSPAAAIGRHIVSEPGVGGYNRCCKATCSA